MKKNLQPSMFFWTLCLSLAMTTTALAHDNMIHTQQHQQALIGVAAYVGKAAPDFELKDLQGHTHKLSSLKGKIVVLEWFNPQCPFVKYAHSKGPLKGFAKSASGKDLVWLAINSSAKGRQGHGVELNQKAKAKFGMDYPILLDEDGKVGKAYGAKTTPHMFVINAKGILVYKGALDNAPLGSMSGKKKTNYVEDAIAALRANKEVKTSQSNAYGCSVKYAR